jgi:hypothetical protein
MAAACCRITTCVEQNLASGCFPLSIEPAFAETLPRGQNRLPDQQRNKRNGRVQGTIKARKGQPYEGLGVAT